MSIALCQTHHSFGLRSNIPGNVKFIDEQTIIFPSGNQLVRFNVELKAQNFIPGSEKTEGMTAIGLSPNRRYVAVAEKSNKPVLIIYDLLHDQSRKRKVLTAPDLLTQTFVSIAFSPDSRYLVAQGGKPDWMMVLWAWEKSKILASIKTSSQSEQAVHQISFNPLDNTQICVIGNHIFKLFRYIDGNLKHFGFQKIETENFLSHAWVSDERVVVGNDDGKLLLFENGEVKGEFFTTVQDVPPVVSSVQDDLFQAGSHRQLSSHEQAINSLSEVFAVVAYSKGFACSGSGGTIYIFEKTNDKELYTKAKAVKIPPDLHSSDVNLLSNEKILSLVVSPSEEMLVAATDCCQLYYFSLIPVDVGKDETLYFERLMYSHHSGPISGLDVCIRKPLAATCSIDHSVRIWNYENNSLEIYKVFQEEAYSIALHPTGLYILVGFSDKLRLLNILIDDIRVFKEITIRGCRECSFTNGGHLFAAVHGSVIQVYSSMTFENVSNLKGHNGKVRSLAWSADDSKLVSCGMDGAVYEWSPTEAKRINEVVLKTCAYSDLTLSPSGKHVYAVGSDKTIKEISESQVVRSIESSGPTLTQIALSRNGKMLFCGTASGTIRSFKFPFTDVGEFNELQGHASAITKIHITFDDQHLLTVSEDACVMIWRICDKDGRGIKQEHEAVYAQEILVTKTDLEEKNLHMSELRTRVDELRMENEYQLRLKDMNYNEKIKELTEKFIQDMDGLKSKNQVLKTEKEKQAAKHEHELADMIEENTKEMHSFETKNNKKLMGEYEKFHELQVKSEKMQEDYDKQLQEVHSSKEQSLHELTEYYETKLREKSFLVEQVQDDSRMQQRESDEMRRQIEEDGDREILEIKSKYERKLREEIDANIRLKGESGIMRKKFTSLNKEIELKNEEIKVATNEKIKLESVIRSLEKDVVSLKKEIQERDETIQDKEKRIYDLKKKNQELEKFKFVLDYKIKELKKQIEPRENDIKIMKEQILEMEGELERFHKQNTQLELIIVELKQKLKASEKELHHEKSVAHEIEGMNRRIKTDIHQCVGYIQEPKKLKECIIAVFHAYVTDDVAKERGLDADIHKEYMRQREHLERSVASLRKKLVKDTEIHRTDNVRIMQENVTLIKEINDLRRVLKSTRSYISDLETSLGMSKRRKVFDSEKQSDLGQDSDLVIRQNNDETARIIEMQRNEIRKLRNQVMDLDDKLARKSKPVTKLLPAITT